MIVSITLRTLLPSTKRVNSMYQGYKHLKLCVAVTIQECLLHITDTVCFDEMYQNLYMECSNGVFCSLVT